MALPGRKSLRQFQCNDTLWVTFRRMAEDQEKEVDDMIADAMEAYAQLSGYQTGINALESESQLTPPPSSAHHRQRPAGAPRRRRRSPRRRRFLRRRARGSPSECRSRVACRCSTRRRRRRRIRTVRRR